MSSLYIFFIILGVDVAALLFQTQQISISASEANILYGDPSFLQVIINFSLFIFGKNDFALRFPMILFHVMSVLLMYRLSKHYIDSERNRVWLILIFILLPGVLSSAIIVNSAGVVIFGLLLYIILIKEKKLSQRYINGLLLIYAFMDIGFSYLFLALSVYHINKKDYKEFIYLIILYMLTSYLYGFDAGGYPTGHFLDIVGVYSAIFTPIIFLYLSYALYRAYKNSTVDQLWYLASITLLLSFILSFRQRVPVEHFAPYLIIGLPIAAKRFIHSYRVRLKIYRGKYKFIFLFSLVLLLLNTFIVYFNTYLYKYIENPKTHFAYKQYIAKELATVLKLKHISCVDTDHDMQLRLKFYDIGKCKQYKLENISIFRKIKPNVTVSYKGRVVYRATVTNINNK